MTGQLEQFTKLMILLNMADNFTLQIQDIFDPSAIGGLESNQAMIVLLLIGIYLVKALITKVIGQPITRYN